ncbi:alkaline phosphatase family protein [Egibacter rhizosphaerae]|uniref:alkaline phosphatase family protein n=1 Tax=Egibacter rhizosphaerae TaxID=1670831 RepID=UPI0013F17D58|nr:nucleotide pyrophosphatase/phosphodiesterase family protein [Egibacter rhizosphaerae]
MAGSRRLGIIVVIDGLRPDAITPQDTPVLHALGQDGAVATQGRAVAPAVTRVNAASMATGELPTRTGITGNLLHVPEVAPAPFTTADARNLLRLRERTGSIVDTVTLAERIEHAGGRFVAVGSGSSGSTLCLNPRAPDGVGTLVNADDPAKGAPFAWPPEVGDQVHARFGPPPPKGRDHSNADSSDYATRIVTDYVLPMLDASVVMLWLTEPDSAQHRHGVGSPAATDALRRADRNVGQLVDQLERLGLRDEANLFVVSDHGFSQAARTVDVAQDLVAAGCKEGPDSTDLVVARTGCVGIFADSEERVPSTVEWLRRQDWADLIFTASHDAASPLGWVDGTFALELLGSTHPTRSPDIHVTLAWNQLAEPTGGWTGLYASTGGSTASAPGGGDHGNLSPADVTTTFRAWGADIARTRSEVPVGNVDLAPTVLALTGLPDEADGRHGRVAHELLTGEHERAEVTIDRRIHTTASADGAYAAELKTSLVAGHRYLDQGRRIRET